MLYDKQIDLLIVYRLISTIKGRLKMAHNEETFQELVAVTCRERSTVKAGKGGHVSKETLKNVVRGPGL